MKWQHWLVWALLATWAIALGACVAKPETEKRYTEAEVQARIAVVVAKEKRAGNVLEKLLTQIGDGKWGLVERKNLADGGEYVRIAVTKPVGGTTYADSRCIVLIDAGTHRLYYSNCPWHR